jgi:hypothetical protein
MHPLSSDEFKQLQRGEFVLHALEMDLIARSGSRQNFSGSGMVRQAPDGSFAFTLYDRSAHYRDERLTDVLPGTWVNPDDLYDLQIRDSRGRRWEGEITFPSFSWVGGQPGAICEGPVTELRSISAEQYAETNTISLFIPETPEIPRDTEAHARARERFEQTRIPQRRGQLWEILEPDFDCSVLRTEFGLEVSFTWKQGSLPRGIDSRIEEALWFVLGQLMWWGYLVERQGSELRCVLRGWQRAPGKSNLGPPLALRASNAVPAVSRMFALYLRRIASFSEPRYHPLSVNLRQVLTGAAITVDTKALALGVSVESLVKREFSSLGSAPTEVADAVNQFLASISSWPDDARLKRRLEGAIRRVLSPDLRTSLTRLSELGVISGEQIDAWNWLRHPAAHGEEIGERIREAVEKARTTYVMFVRLIFHVIGYVGPYTDWGSPGWPEAEFVDLPRFRGHGV